MSNNLEQDQPNSPPRRRFTLRRMIILVAMIAVLLASWMWIGKQIDDAIPTTDPVKWASRHAALFSDGFGGDTAFNQQQASRYAKLAKGFRRLKATSQEATYCGPFTDILPNGQTVIIQLEAPCEALEPIPAGTSAVVISDAAFDADGCSDSRTIEVRLLDGTDAGKVAQIERIYLRRKP